MGKLLIPIFYIIAFVELYAEATSNQLLVYIFKPLIMPLLAGIYIHQNGGIKNVKDSFMIAAFVFSLIGDIALMFQKSHELYFMLGLASFLITHILYTAAFFVESRKSKSKVFLIFSIPVVIYAAVLLWHLIPNLSDLKIPVVLYSFSIAIMVIFAMKRFKTVHPASFGLVITGAILFMFSDSLIAYNKFISAIPQASLFIMTLYIIGQYYIATGSALSGYGITKKDGKQ